MAFCKKCGNDMPTKRAQLGYENCVQCSSEPKWSGVPIIHHKTGNEIQIVKDPRDAAEFMAKSARGFGAAHGVAGSFVPELDAKEPPAISLIPPTKPQDKVVARKKPDTSKYDDESVAKRVLEIQETVDTAAAKAHLEREFQSLRISPASRKRLLIVLSQFSDSQE
jgi:hypothetical protein